MNRLLRAAYRSGGRRVQIESGASRTRVTFDSLACPVEGVEGLLEQLLGDRSTSRVEMADAINFALAVPGSRLELRLDDGRTATVLELDGREVHAYRIESRLRPSTTFQLERTSSSMSGWGTASKEYLSVLRRFRYSPLEISINGEFPPTQVSWGGPDRQWNLPRSETLSVSPGLFSFGQRIRRAHHAVEVRLVHPEPGKNGVGLPPSEASGFLRHGKHHPRGPGVGGERCRLALGLCMDSGRGSQAAWVYAGETLQVFPVALELPGLEMLITADDLRLDLGGEKIVQNSEFERLWTQVKGDVETLTSALVRTYSTTPRKLASKAYFDEERQWRRAYLKAVGQPLP